MEKLVLWFDKVGKEDVELVGGKGANLGEMTSIGMPVPPGFVVTAESYKRFLEENKIKPKIHELLDDLDVNNPEALDRASKVCQKLILSSKVPQDVADEIVGNYLKLGDKISSGKGPKFLRLLRKLRRGDPLVAVRSSATSEDSKAASFAGQNETFLDVCGEANLVDAVKRCWASLFVARSIFYRVQNHFDHLKSFIAVVVQAMVPSEVSGVMFSIDPVTNNKSRVVIETVWGLGEYIVQGKVTPDHYEVNKTDLFITDRKFVDQKVMLVRKVGAETKEVKVPKSKQEIRKINDEQIKRLAELSIALEKHYFFPQDSEFAVAHGEVFLVQTRPITTTNSAESGAGSKEMQKLAHEVDEELKVILTGAPASPGVKSGHVKVLKSAAEINKVIPGDILVAEQTNPDYVPAMKKAAAIVTDKGGRTSHAAIVSRELGIPCVVGTDNATKLLKTGDLVTVNGAEGKVFKGAIRENPKPEIRNPKQASEIKNIKEEIKTATKVYMNLAEPELARQMAARNVDGVGLLRAEFMLAGIGIHPKEIIHEHKQKMYIDKLTEQLTEFAQAFYPRPVVYRATDFKTNEYKSLKGGEKYEPHEENPMIGFRGAYRYIVQPEVFQMEIEAIKNVRNKKGFRNLHLMIPFCRTVKELHEVKKLLEKFELRRTPTFKLWMMCEIPANVILLDKFIEEGSPNGEAGIDGISVGSNDLTMLTLGVDRDNENVASEYDELNEAVIDSFERIIKTCNKYKVTCSMCGQAPSDYPELTEKLVELGITSVSVNPDVIERTREIVAAAEKKLINK